jgi:serine/threonine protein kinase
MLNDRYRLERVIGSGGMGVVFAAYDSVLDRQVAVKITNLEASAHTERLMSEARILAKLDHPGIVPVHDAGQGPDGRWFYVMKLIEGDTLEEFIQREISLAVKLRLFQDISNAVAFAHSVGVIHRDLTPRNVMIGTFGETLILDWGLARGFEETSAPAVVDKRSARITQDGTVAGTPAFMAPEQAKGLASEVTELTDVYGLGAILYFLLEQKPPFAESDRATYRKQIIEDRPPAFTNSVPKPLAAICFKCLEKATADRYASVNELRSEVSRFIDSEPVGAYRENAFEVVQRWAVRSKPILILILAYLVMRVIVALAARQFF